MNQYLAILRQYWGYEGFRGIQEKIIESIGSGKDTLGLMPTGGGKSITFQVPALAQDGVCLVISPLIALMKDQVANLRQRGIIAAAIYSGMARREVVKILDNCILGDTKLLYVSPERLSSDLFLQKLSRIRISFITVDEAHCISQWGYDFRPSYLEIERIRKLKPYAPILALTATATPGVVKDIQAKLNFRTQNVFSMSFERKKLAYVVRKTMNKDIELIHILNSVEGSAIVYVYSRKHCKTVSKMLCDNGLQATYYHAGLDPSVKDQRQSMWSSGQIRIIVCTNAFGMGIDKPDVRLVVHYEMPDSLEAYFQEAGRAGRDGRKSYAVLLHNEADKNNLKRRIQANYPALDFIKNVYEHLAYYYQIGIGSGMGHRFTFDADKFGYIYKFYPLAVTSALRILHNAGYIEYEEEPDTNTRCKILLTRHELYRFDDNTEAEERVVTAMLRTYSGLFADYQYISLPLIAHRAELPEEEVYHILRSFTQRNIMSFIPQRKMPYISYTRPREPIEYLVLPERVYAQRKQQYMAHIQDMLEYAHNDNICRSRQLLRYFGEKKTTDCAQCDVCISKRDDPLSEKNLLRVKQEIIEVLSDKQKHLITDIQKINRPLYVLGEALKDLVREYDVRTEGVHYWIE